MSIELPVDIGENALKYSTTERLQEIFVTVIEYLITSENSPQEWMEYLSTNNYESMTLLSKATERLVELEIEENEQNEENKETEETQETEDTVDDYNNASALSLLCQILVMFGSLNAAKLCPIIVTHAYQHILCSIKYHTNLKRFDTVNRLKLIEFMAIYHKKMKIESIYIEILCLMLESEYIDVIETASSSLIYLIGRSNKSDMKLFLQLLENKLSSDTLRHFTQFYFKLLNSIDFNECKDDRLELLISFNSNVFKYNLDSFYFSSDIKVLIDIYIRSFHNTAPTNNSLLLCLDGVYNIIRWKQYMHKLKQYKSSKLLQELNDLFKIVQIAAHDFQENENIAADYTQQQLLDVVKLIEKIEHKINIIILTLNAINNGEYDYDVVLDEIIKLPVDISQYALDTKSINTLQQELLQLLQFLAESTNTAQEWIDFLSDNGYEIFNRLCLLSDRLLIKENQIFNDENKELEDKEDDDDDVCDEELLFPFSSLCQLLATFSSLNPVQFAPILKENMFKNILTSLENANKLNSDDIVTRLQTINFLILNIDINFNDSDDEMYFYKVLIDLLLNEYEPVLILTTKCIVYYIAKLNDGQKEQKYLLYLQKTLSDDDFRHFTEHYFAIANDTDWNENENDIETKLLIDFVVCVIKNGLDDFFFSSDLKVLIDIFERTLHNLNVNANVVDYLIDAIHVLFNWDKYKNELNGYHYHEVCTEIKSCIDNAIENQLFELAERLDPLLRIPQ